MVPEAFKQGRAKMSGGTFSTEAMKALAPFARDQWRAHADFVAETLEDGRDFMGGAKPGAADIHAYMNFWWIKAAIPHLAPSLLAEFPKIDPWCARVAAIGHGDPRPMEAKDALAVAKAAASEAQEAPDPSGRFGRDPVAGHVVFANAHEIAIRRNAAEVGDIVVHFPRAGFNVAAA
jgi:hypothetical protein